MRSMTMKRFMTTVSALSGRKDQDGMLISTPTVDRDGDRVMPQGVDLTNFERNSPLLWAHNYKDIPIGTVTSVDVREDGIRAWWRWLENDSWADRVKNAWRQGVVRAASIGFSPKRSVPNDFGGHDILSWDLLEASLVPIGANPEAVRTLKALGLDHGNPVPLINDSSTWTPQSIAQIAVKNLERRWTDYSEGCEPILLIEEEREPVLFIEEDQLREDQFMIDLDQLDKEIEKTITNGVVSVVSDAVRREVNYHRGRIE